jgi:hypothetical protein
MAPSDAVKLVRWPQKAMTIAEREATAGERRAASSDPWRLNKDGKHLCESCADSIFSRESRRM